jgi:TRAP-type mannitol/chloroaromatic compound transport system permease small subunit
LAASGYTFLREGHVRVDIFYRSASPRAKAIVDVLGAYLFLFPVTIILFAVSFPYVRQSWLFKEGSRESGGIPFVYGLKALILVFCILLFLQGLSLTIRNLRRLTGLEPYPSDEPKPAS